MSELFVVTAGHLDHGKSSVLGRLLYDTGSVPKEKIDAVARRLRDADGSFPYAFLLDVLKEERKRGITMDTARAVFSDRGRRYHLIDTPGQTEFLKNMVTGAARADAAFLVLDALQGPDDNSRRHGYLLALLGVTQIVVLVNKMDLVDYSRDVYEDVAGKYREYLGKTGVQPERFIPVSAAGGDNIAVPSIAMPWYRGVTVLDCLRSLRGAASLRSAPFRMPIQDVYRGGSIDNGRPVIVGTVESGSIAPGNEVEFYPSKHRGKVRMLGDFGNDDRTMYSAGEAAAFILEKEAPVGRGDIVARAGEAPPSTGTTVRALCFWMGREPLRRGEQYGIKLSTARVTALLEEISLAIDPSTLEEIRVPAELPRFMAGECVFSLGRPLAWDIFTDNPATGRLVIVDHYEIAGGGVVREAE